MNAVQNEALDLIREDARFIYALVNIFLNAENIESNYFSMGLPYIGLFADGAEQWCKKVGLPAPAFSEEEKWFYTQVRQGHKLLARGLDEYERILFGKFKESDQYFYRIRSPLEKIIGYYNVGTDLINGKFCGNTILCASYILVDTLNKNTVGPWLREVSRIAGELAAYVGAKDYPVYKYNDNNKVTYKDYHFYRNSPLNLKMNNPLGFLLFSVLCSINYVIEFIDKYFIEEIPQKFKFAYLQYYYLCDFIKEINLKYNTKFELRNHLCDRKFRNCLAHYGLGQFIKESEIVHEDMMKGLTQKAFGMDYFTAKSILYDELNRLAMQIEQAIL